MTCALSVACEHHAVAGTAQQKAPAVPHFPAGKVVDMVAPEAVVVSTHHEILLVEFLPVDYASSDGQLTLSRAVDMQVAGKSDFRCWFPACSRQRHPG